MVKKNYYEKNEEYLQQYRESRRPEMLIYHKNWYIVNKERVKFYNEDRKEIISKYYKDRRNACKKIEEKIEIKPRNICKFGF